MEDYKIKNGSDLATKYQLAIAYGKQIEWTGDKFCRIAIPAYLRRKGGLGDQLSNWSVPTEALIKDFKINITHHDDIPDIRLYVIKAVLARLDRELLKEQLEATRLSLERLPAPLLPDALTSWNQITAAINC